MADPISDGIPQTTVARPSLGARSSGPRSSSLIGGSLRRVAGTRMEKVLFGKQEVQLPEALVEDVNVFMEIMSASTWKNVLTDSQRRRLLTLLPSFPQNEVLEKQETLRQAFGGQNFKFGNPLRHFHKKLRDGLFSPDIAKYAALCRRAKLREYRYQQQVYYATLLKEILVNRQRILEQVYQVAPDKPIQFEHFQWRPAAIQDRCLDQRVNVKVTEILKEVNEECGPGDSSDEDSSLALALVKPSSAGSASKPSSAGSAISLLNDSPENSQLGCSVQSTLDTRPPPPQEDGKPAAVPKRSRISRDFTDQDLKHMISRHKKRKREYPDHPELDTRSVLFEDLLTRCNLGKKTLKATQRKRVKAKAAGLHSDSKKSAAARARAEPVTAPPGDHMSTLPPQAVEPASSVLATPLKPSASQYTVMMGPDEDMPDASVSLAGMEAATTIHGPETSLVAQKTTEYGQHNNFFSLLRDFICEETETKINTAKLEERVREWQESASAKVNPWFTELPGWTEVVSSALKFLAGDVLGLKLENFIPLLDYKERAQHWKWIAQGRDADSQLAVLYQYWRENSAAGSLADGGAGDRASSPPPPRQRTTFVVRPTTDAERNSFHDQEELRFTNPHKSFTYDLHGYESVVGPVKGVFEKESNMNKAREHALLISDRPAFVTILTLVRDAAARLPNGEGTRADICELLKDSQYLSPGVTDAQINTVVSGALDRLHYEKDPCVKYDVNRKLWIYLHRNRTEDDFERIHEAERAAAKAKKALGKSKPSKKAKEAASSQATTAAVAITVATPTVTMATPVLTRQSSVLSTGSNDSFINVESLSPTPSGTSPRPSAPASPRAGGATGSSPRILQASPLVGQGGKGAGQQQVVGGAKLVASLGGSPKATSISQVLQGIPTSQATQGGVGISLVQPQQGASIGTLAPGAKPLAFSLIQTHGRTKLVETSTASSPGASPAETPKSVLAQSLTGSPTASPLVSSPRTPQTPTTPLRGPRPQQPSTPPAAPAQPGPRLTRLVQQLSLPQHAQLMAAVGGRGAQSGVVRQKLVGLQHTAPKTTQGSALLATLQGTQTTEACVTDTAAESPAPAPPQATKTPTFITKQGDKVTMATTTQPQTVVSTATGVVNPAQILQSATLGGNPAAFGGNPIIIGGKQALLSGKPLQIGGTSLQLIGKPGAQFVQSLPAGVTAVNVMTQASTSHTVSTSMVSSQTAVTKATLPSSSSPLQILQTIPSTKVTQTALKVTGASASTSAGAITTGTRVFTQRPGGGLVMTQIPQTGGIAKQGIPAGAQAKALTVSQANLLAAAAGQQIFVQQGGAGSQARVVTPQQLLSGTGLRPTMLAASSAAAGGKPGQSQNIQLVKTVLTSQPGDKPGQTTILLTQPLTSGGSGGAGTMATSAVQLTQASAAATGKVATVATSKSKTGPVYARIITPPPGIRLAAVRPGQVTQVVTPGQVSPMPAGVNVIQTLSRVPLEAQQGGQSSTTASDTPSSSDSEQK